MQMFFKQPSMPAVAIGPKVVVGSTSRVPYSTNSVKRKFCTFFHESHLVCVWPLLFLFFFLNKFPSCADCSEEINTINVL